MQIFQIFFFLRSAFFPDILIVKSCSAISRYPSDKILQDQANDFDLLYVTVVCYY